MIELPVLTNFPLDYNDQINVIEIFDGMMWQWDDAVKSLKLPSASLSGR